MMVHPTDADDDERALVARLRRGDVGAFDRVYGDYHGRLYSFVLRLSGRRDTAEDLAQETWLRLARAAPTLQPDTALAPLLFTIARNAFLSHRRWAMLDLSRLVTFGLEVLTAPPTQASPETDHESARALQLLEGALQQVPVAMREVLLLIGVEGLEQDEVARMLGISHAALRQRLSRARAELAETMIRLEKRQQTGKAGKQGVST